MTAAWWARTVCWWRGHEIPLDYFDTAGGHQHCERCGQWLGYHELVTGGARDRVGYWCEMNLWRRWKRCPSCGKRWGCTDECLPF